MALVSFIVPLRSPQSCSDWSTVSALCKRTLGSLANQSSSDWHCLLVCNEPPLQVGDMPKVTVIQDRFPIPQDHRERMLDKGRKKRRGLAELRSRATEYVMCLDADDLLHRRLVEFVADHSADPGWLLARGYEYASGRFALQKSNFHMGCGSSCILRHEGIVRDPRPFLMSHVHVKGYYDQIGRPLAKLPFYGALHILETGQNNQNRSLPRVTGLRSALYLARRLKPVTRRIRDTYNLYPLRV